MTKSLSRAGLLKNKLETVSPPQTINKSPKAHRLTTEIKGGFFSKFCNLNNAAKTKSPNIPANTANEPKIAATGVSFKAVMVATTDVTAPTPIAHFKIGSCLTASFNDGRKSFSVWGDNTVLFDELSMPIVDPPVTEMFLAAIRFAIEDFGLGTFSIQ